MNTLILWNLGFKLYERVVIMVFPLVLSEFLNLGLEVANLRFKWKAKGVYLALLSSTMKLLKILPISFGLQRMLSIVYLELLGWYSSVVLKCTFFGKGQVLKRVYSQISEYPLSLLWLTSFCDVTFNFQLVWHHWSLISDFSFQQHLLLTEFCI